VDLKSQAKERQVRCGLVELPGISTAAKSVHRSDSSSGKVVADAFFSGMKTRISVASLNTTPLDWEGNLTLAFQAMDQARKAGSRLLLLPELCLSGYGCEDAFLAPWVARQCLENLRRLAEAAGDLLVVAGLPLLVRGDVYNASALVSHGKIHGAVCKRHLAREGLHYEPRWFTPWRAGDFLSDGGAGFPVGDQIFQIEGVRIGIEICEDAWAVDRPGLGLAAGSADVILCPSASHFSLGKDEVRERLVLESSRVFGCAYAYATLVGNEAGRIPYDGAGRIALHGRILAKGSRLSFRSVEVHSADIDLDSLRMRRASAGHAIPQAVPVTTMIEQALPAVTGTVAPDFGSDPNRDGRNGDFARCAALCLWDYLRKSHSNGFVLSLSGGADSAACAVLVHLACRFALEDLGEEGFRAALPWIDLPKESLTAIAATRALLMTAYQPTANSGEITKNAAQAVAQGVGGEFRIMDVDALVKGYLAIGEAALGRSLDWQRDDLALQNIQARVRAPSVWLLANVMGRLLISTSNRSEMAVGYATMDGDTAGSLSPLAGVDKHFLLQWLGFLETRGILEGEPMAFLSVITAQAPTAELRPRREGEAEQTDEADLMPYPLLDAIQRLAIVERKSPGEIFHSLGGDAESPEGRMRLKQAIGRFFRLWSRNQWKRERYAPSFHLDDHNLDPRSWCRFPILSGGFVQELSSLEME
jgi:NAD+ synthase (glutamine-hydrolysing)